VSRHAYAPYAPINVLKPVCPDLWIVDGPEIRFRYLGLKLPFPTRMTVLRLSDSRLWLHSPIEPADTLVEEIHKIGSVRFLIAPNTLHYWWISDWATCFPDAETFAAPGLERSAKRRIDIRYSLGDVPPAVWAGVIDQVLVKGDVLTEVDFFHRPSRTLILTDLIENFEPERVRSWLYRKLVSWSGAADPDGKAPIDMRLSFWRHRKALKAAVERMIAWEPARIILAHGRYYETGGMDELRRAFRWIL
jgi:Domain of unknown function (DUF4336)